jgi:signal transduction histidine kinase
LRSLDADPAPVGDPVGRSGYGPGRGPRRPEPDEQRLDALGEFAGRVAHDFNNLLAVILNYAAFAAEELAAAARVDWEAAARDVGQVQRAAEQAAALTGQLRALSRRDSVRPRTLHLDDVITDAAPLLRRTLGPDIVLRADLDPHPWPVLADAGLIEQVLVNLATNARDAMSGGGTLTIETRNVDRAGAGSDPGAGSGVGTGPEAGAGSGADTGSGPGAGSGGTPTPADRCVRLRVSDTGSGMVAEVAEHALEPLFTTGSGIGAGLGLSTVYGILAQMGATIDIRSWPGAGTTITIMVPVTDERPEPVQDVPTPF